MDEDSDYLDEFLSNEEESEEDEEEVDEVQVSWHLIIYIYI